MAEFNNKKPYNKNNNNGKYNNNFSYDNKDREFKKPFNNNSPRNNKPKAPAPVVRPNGIENIPNDAYELISYKMTKAMADTILKENKGKRPTQEVLCEYVNTQLGLKGYCVSVSYF